MAEIIAKRPVGRPRKLIKKSNERSGFTIEIDTSFTDHLEAARRLIAAEMTQRLGREVKADQINKSDAIRIALQRMTR